MREIKFRAWNKETNCFFIWDLTFAFGGTGKVWGDVQQYTGLKDKNGKEIYEGDILNYDGEPTIIEYVDDMFHCKSTKYKNLTPGNYRLATLHNRCQIIGNIHENPELLPDKR